MTAVSERQVAQAEADALKTHGLGRLPFEGPNLTGDLIDHVRDARQILLRQRQLVHGLTALALIFCNPRRFLEHDPPFLWL